MDCAYPSSDESLSSGDLGPVATGSGGGMLIAGLAKVLFGGDLETFMLIAAPALAGAITYWWSRTSRFVSVGIADYLDRTERVRFYHQSRRTLCAMRDRPGISARRKKELDQEIEALDRVFSDTTVRVFRKRMKA